MKSKGFMRLMYALGYLGITIVGQTSVKWYQFFYTPPEINRDELSVLVPLGLIGFAMIIGRIFDGIADPLVAYWSDNTRSRLGRRIPFVLFGALPLVATFVLLWFPPVQGESIWNFVYLSIMLSLFFIFFTIVVAPYLALIGDISKTKEERIRLTMMMGVVQVVGVIIAEAGSSAIIDMYNFKVMGIVLGVVSLLSILLTPMFVREEQSKVETGEQLGLFSSVKKTLSNRNFAYYLVTQLAIWFGINTMTIAMPYVCAVLLGVKAETSGMMIGAAFVLACLVSLFIPKVVLKFGKRNTMMAAAVMFGLILMSIGLFGTVITGIAAWVIVALVGVPLAATFVIPNAMVADIAELDGITHGVRREGMFFGTQGLFNKFVLGFSSLITPWLFSTFGFTTANPLGLQIAGPFAGLVVIIGAYFMRYYTLTDDISEAHNTQQVC